LQDFLRAWLELSQSHIAETAEVAPKDQVDKPLSFENVQALGVQIGPPVVIFQVLRQG
jgi:hypothetical protein